MNNKSRILIALLTLLFSLTGCSSAKEIVKTEASNDTVEYEKPNVNVVKIDADSELGEQISQMDEYVYGQSQML